MRNRERGYSLVAAASAGALARCYSTAALSRIYASGEFHYIRRVCTSRLSDCLNVCVRNCAYVTTKLFFFFF